MSADLSLFGIFVNGGLVAAIGAGLVLLPIRSALVRLDVYRHFWHPPLVNLALFVVLWGGVARVLQSPRVVTVLLG